MITTLQDYEARLSAECGAIQLESGVLVSGGKTTPTRLPGGADGPPWIFELFILFPDGKYVRIWEQFNRVAGSDTYGRRDSFSFHYGPTPPTQNEEGAPVWQSSDPRDIRIDLDSISHHHLHYGDEDHIPQYRVTGLEIGTMNPKTFLEGIIKHRQSNKPFDEVFGFRIERT